ncbi:hypothetical protein ACIBO2_12335 [Nonomuraea sp. NPDC050022]|uniref:hypothetical protein n=1 Tax=Nonomuraea sp. NPDC050022 TaxID=3364358 RepID=UPI0037AB4CE9
MALFGWAATRDAVNSLTSRSRSSCDMMLALMKSAKPMFSHWPSRRRGPLVTKVTSLEAKNSTCGGGTVVTAVRALRK